MPVLNSIRFALTTLGRSRVPRMAPEAVARLQQRRLRRLLRYAAARSPFYRAKLRGLDPDRCDLADVPVTTKSELMAHFDDVVTDPRVRRADVEAFVRDPANATQLYLGGYAVCHTSGSQGERLLVLEDPPARELLFACQMSRGNVCTRNTLVEAAYRLVVPARIAAVATFTRAAFTRRRPPGSTYRPRRGRSCASCGWRRVSRTSWTS